MRTLYHSIGYTFEDPLVKWAYYLLHAHSTLNSGLTAIYSDLLAVAKSKTSYAVLTSNADTLFVQSGFDPARVWTPQGTYANLQCLDNCTPTSFFPTLPWAQELSLSSHERRCVSLKIGQISFHLATSVAERRF